MKANPPAVIALPGEHGASGAKTVMEGLVPCAAETSETLPAPERQYASALTGSVGPAGATASSRYADTVQALPPERLDSTITLW